MGESAWQVVEESTCSVSEDPTIGFRTDGESLMIVRGRIMLVSSSPESWVNWFAAIFIGNLYVTGGLET